LLDKRAAHAAQPEIDRKGQPNRARPDDENLGVDHQEPPVPKTTETSLSNDGASLFRRLERCAMSMVAQSVE
jgi:hypothetical protein